MCATMHGSHDQRHVANVQLVGTHAEVDEQYTGGTGWRGAHGVGIKAHGVCVVSICGAHVWCMCAGVVISGIGVHCMGK